MQIFRKIISAVVLISGAFFVVLSLIDTVSSTIRVISLGVALIGGGIWFLMQMERLQKPKEEAQKPKKDNPRKPFAKEDELSSVETVVQENFRINTVNRFLKLFRQQPEHT